MGLVPLEKEADMIPITGPFVRVKGNTLDGNGSWHSYKRGYRQQKPYNLPTEYFQRFRACTFSQWVNYDSFGEHGFGGSADSSAGIQPGYLFADTIDPSHPEVTNLINLALRKFNGKLSSAELGTALLEGRKTMDMLTSRLLQFANFLGAMKKGNFSKAAQYLGNPDSERFKRVTNRARYRAKSFGSQILEVQWGWMPTVSDIGSAVDVLQSDFDSKLIRGKSEGAWREQLGHGIFRETTLCTHGCFARVLVSGRVRISNPNLYLANKLGFINPASTAWEITSYSWLVDWFANVGQFLASFTDRLGLDITEAFHTISTYQAVNRRTLGESDFPVPNVYQRSVDSFCVSTSRRLGHPEVTLQLRPLRLTPSRALSAAALLLSRARV